MSKAWSMLDVCSMMRRENITGRCQWKQDAEWRQAALQLIWHIVKTGNAKRLRKIRDMVAKLPSWQSAESLSTFQKKRGSYIYAMVNLKTAWTYVGLVQDRNPEDRWQEHTRGMKQGQDAKYRRMKALGLEEWYMIPIAEFPETMGTNRLRTIEQIYIKKFHKSLNNYKPYKRQVPENKRKVKRLRQVEKAEGTTGRKQGMSDTSQQPNWTRWIQAVDSEGQATTWEKIILLGEGMIHLDAGGNKLTIKRRFGRSVALAYPVTWTNNKCQIRKTASIQTVTRLLKSNGWFYFKLGSFENHRQDTDELEQEMKKRLRANTKCWYKLSSMEELWRMCKRVGRIRDGNDKKRAKLHLAAALRKKGLMTNPFKPLIVAVPGDAAVQRRGVRAQVRRILSHSDLPKSIVRDIKVRIIQKKSPTGISILSNYKQIIKRMETEEPE